MTFWQGLLLLVYIALLAFAIYARMQRLKLPVRFASGDELNAVVGVARWAGQQYDLGDPRRQSITSVWMNLRPWLGRMGVRLSKHEVAMLAPFIDQVIAGQGPPLNLPAEYEDTRPAALGAFKARMQAEGLWPREAVSS
jgi:hypothetical protein